MKSPRSFTPTAIVRLLRQSEIKRFILFLMVGSVNFIFYYSVFATLHLAGVEPTPAVIAATVLGVLFNFGTTGRIVFASDNLRLLPRFIGVYVVQCGLNILSLNALIGLGVPVLVAEALVVGVLAVATFLALRRFVFSIVAARAAERNTVSRHLGSECLSKVN